MRTLRVLAGVVLFIMFVSIVAPTAVAGGDPTGDEYTLLRICEAVVRLFQREANVIWPGYSLAEQPFLVYIPDKWALLFNVSGPIDGFQAYPEDWPDLGCCVLYHEGRYGDLVGQLEFDVGLGEITTVAVGFPEGFSARVKHPMVEALSYIVHEAFHQYQHGAFGEIPWAREEKYPIADLDNSALAWLEMCVLRDALEAAAAEDSERCRQSAKELVAVRRHRWAGSDPFVAEYEQGKELLEGTAKYVELRCVERMSHVDYVSSLDGITNPLTDSLPHASMPELLLQDLRERMEGGCLQPQDIPRNRIYAVAGGQSFLLDYFGIDWKGRAEEAGPDFTYIGFLRDHFGVEERALVELVEQTKYKYDYEAMLRSAREAAEVYEQAYARELETFEAQPGRRLEVSVSSSGVSRSRVSRAKKWLVNNGRSCLCNHFKVYTLRGGNWMLEVHDAGLLEINDWDAGYKEVVFYDSGIDAVTIDGEPAPLPLFGTQEFDSLKIAGSHFELSSSKSGSVVFDGDTVRFLLDPVVAARGE